MPLCTLTITLSSPLCIILVLSLTPLCAGSGKQTDRVDPAGGYVPGNVVACCTPCNMAKVPQLPQYSPQYHMISCVQGMKWVNYFITGMKNISRYQKHGIRPLTFVPHFTRKNQTIPCTSGSYAKYYNRAAKNDIFWDLTEEQFAEMQVKLMSMFLTLICMHVNFTYIYSAASHGR